MDRYSRKLADIIKNAEDMRDLYRARFEVNLQDAFPHLNRTWDEFAGMYVDPKTQEFWFMFRCGAECETTRMGALDTRTAFKDWVSREYPMLMITRNPDGAYHDSRTETLWSAYVQGASDASS